MPIISISVNEKLAGEMEKLSDISGFSGKSELFRAAVRGYLNSHYLKILSPEKQYSASLSVVIPEHKRGELHRIHDKYGQAVRSQFHLCLEEDRCMEVFGLTGKGRVISDLIRLIEVVPKVEKISLCVDS